MTYGLFVGAVVCYELGRGGWAIGCLVAMALLVVYDVVQEVCDSLGFSFCVSSRARDEYAECPEYTQAKPEGVVKLLKEPSDTDS